MLSLTPRQVEVLRLAARGFTHKGIALALGISPKTVEKHLANSYETLNVQSRTEAVVVAMKAGLL